jgi:outer membrane protein TolC
MTLREVRTAWFELAYLERAEAVARDQARWLEALVEAATTAYSTGVGLQSDVLAARLESLDVRERLIMYGRERAMRRAELVRYAGEPASGELALGFAAPGALAPLAELERGLATHPRLQMKTAEAHAAGDEAALAKERYKPGFGLDVSYGFRQGTGMDGEQRPDLASAMLMFEVPLFTRNRQDREVAAARAMQRSADQQREGEVRALAAELASAHGRARELADLVRLYREDGARLAGVSIESALAVFRSGGGDFMNVVAMQGRAFTVRERQARAEADLAIAGAELDYLAGSQP